MRRIIYSSQANYDVAPGDLVKLLEVARHNNKRLGVTGMLLYCNNSFLQVLEGDAKALTRLIGIISQDPRHSNFRVLLDEEVPGRLFPDWTVGFENVREDDLAEHLEGFTPGTKYPLADSGIVTDGVVAQTLLTLHAQDASARSASENEGIASSRADGAEETIEAAGWPFLTDNKGRAVIREPLASGCHILAVRRRNRPRFSQHQAAVRRVRDDEGHRLPSPQTTAWASPFSSCRTVRARLAA